MAFIVNDGHCYPILNQDTLTSIAHGKQEIFTEDYQFKTDYSKHIYIKAKQIINFIKGKIDPEIKTVLYHPTENQP